MSRVPRANKAKQPLSSRSTPATTPPEQGGLALLVTFAVCTALTLLSYARDLARPFSNDDFLFLEKVAWTPFRRLFDPSEAMIGYFRPWSRELHFWWISRAFGDSPLAFHSVNLALWLGAVGLLLLTLRRISGTRIASIATLGAVATSAWGLYPVWASCSQDLWMLLFSLAFLHSFLARRRVLAAFMLALALLSKETAVVVLPIAAWLDRFQPAAARARPATWSVLVAIIAAWALIHPSLGGRLLFSSGVRLLSTPSQSSFGESARFLLAAVNLEHWPRPHQGWASVLPECLAWGGGIGGAAVWLSRRAKAGTAPAPDRAGILQGLGWWALAWLPLAAPFLQWHSYYGWLGLCGAWLAFASWLAPRPRLAVAMLVLVALLRPAQARTMHEEWATEEYQRVAGERLAAQHASLVAKHPALPPHARVFFAGLPGGMGFRNGVRYSAPMRVWYRDTTVVGGLFGDYVPRATTDPAGPDYFYVADPSLRLMPVASAPVPVADSLRGSELWRIAEEQMANTFTDFGEWSKAMGGYDRLAQAWPDTARHAFNLGVCLIKLGSTDRARSWLDRADSLTGSPPLEGRGYLAAQPR